MAACVAGAVLAIVAISGCGQKGPLYWPQDKLEEIDRKRDEKKPAKTGQLPAVSQLAANA